MIPLSGQSLSFSFQGVEAKASHFNGFSESFLFQGLAASFLKKGRSEKASAGNGGSHNGPPWALWHLFETMTKLEFETEILKRLQDEVGEKYHFDIQDIRKNNNVVLRGLLVTYEGGNIAPTIYLDYFYTRLFTEKMTWNDIIQEIVAILRRECTGRKVDLSFFEKFETVEERICYKLINAERNEELLKEIPFIPFLDLAICFYVPYSSEMTGEGSILIRNAHLDLWGANVSQVWSAAKKNTTRLMPSECEPMDAILSQIVKTEGELSEVKDLQMLVLSNAKHVFGATVILYENLLTGMAERMQESFYILPCSIHEVIILPRRGEECVAELKEMIRNVNATEVSTQEILSDNLYFYDKKANRLQIVV